MSLARLSAAFVAGAFERSRAGEWGLSRDAFHDALEASIAKAFAGRESGPSDVERYVQSLHLGDLALAAACGAGLSRAWDHFIREYRPVLYRAADAIDRTGTARELADSLYGELYGLGGRDAVRSSLFRYFHGRSTLATWLRAVLAQRFVDQRRAARRLDPLPEEEPTGAADAGMDPDRSTRMAALKAVFLEAVGALAARDRLRLVLYYVHEMTLSAIGRQFGEHEATVSRQLARVRRALKEDVDRRLTTGGGMNSAAIDQCWREVIEDPGALDLRVLVEDDRKNVRPERSMDKERV